MTGISIGFSDRTLSDASRLYFGEDRDYSMRYDETEDELVFEHEASGSEWRIDSNGSVSAENGISVPSDERIYYGDDDDYSTRHDSQSGSFIIEAEDTGSTWYFTQSGELSFSGDFKIVDGARQHYGTDEDYFVEYRDGDDSLVIGEVGGDDLLHLSSDGVDAPNGSLTQNGVPTTVDPDSDVYVEEDGSDYVAYDSSGVIDQGTDGPTVLQSAVDATPSGGVLVVSGTYTIDTSGDTISLGDDITIRGNGATIETSVANDEVLGSSATTGSEVSLSADAAAGQRTITVSDASGFTEGELIGLKRDTLVDAKEQSELHKIRSISGTDITVEDTLFFGYTTADNAVAQPIETIEMHIEGIDVVGTGAEERGLALDGVQDGSVRNCSFDGVSQWAMVTSHSYNVTIENNTVSDSNMDGYGYAVIPSNGVARIQIQNNTFDECRHAISVGNSPSPIGLPRSVYVENNFFSDGLGNAADAHGDVISMTCRGNEVHLDGDRTAFFMGAIENIVEDNQVYGSLQTTLYQPRDDGQIDTVKVKNNDIWLDGDTGYDVPLIGLSADNAPYKNVIIEDNVLHEGFTNAGFLLYPTTDTIKVTGNVLRGYQGTSLDPSGGGTFVDTVALGGNATTIRISDNVFREAQLADGAVTLNLTGGDDTDVVIDNNTFINCLGSSGGGGAVEISGGTGVVLRDNEVLTNDGTYLWYGFWLTGSTTESVIKNNTFAHPDNIVAVEIDGHDGPDTLMLNNHNNNDARSVEPVNPTEGWEYLDDGTNTSSGNPGYRYYDGTAWNDL